LIINYPAASSGVSKTLNSVIPHLIGIQSGLLDSGFRRNDELAASGGEYNPKGFNRSSPSSPFSPPGGEKGDEG